MLCQRTRLPICITWGVEVAGKVTIAVKMKMGVCVCVCVYMDKKGYKIFEWFLKKHALYGDSHIKLGDAG